MSNFFKKLAGIDSKKIKVDNENDESNEEMDDELMNDDEETSLGPEEAEAEEDNWIDEDYEEGQLSIDIYQTPKAIIVKSTIAGVNSEDIDISINNDMLTIRGKREENEEIKEEDYLYKECYWGSFSRSVILPVEVEADKIEAVLENGVLTITLPKAKTSKQISVKVKDR